MKLPHGWSAAFIDAEKRVILTKPGARNVRKIYLRYNGNLRRTDAQGNPSIDNINPIAPETKLQIMAECARRW